MHHYEPSEQPIIRPARLKIVDEQEVKRWYDEGRTYRWMVEEYARKYHLEVGLTMFSMLRARRGWPARQVVDRSLIPWAVKREHRFRMQPTMLRALARRRAGVVLPEDTGRKLDSWLTWLGEANAVVHYTPEEGWSYVPRHESDVDVVRQPLAGQKRARSAHLNVESRRPRDVESRRPRDVESTGRGLGD